MKTVRSLLSVGRQNMLGFMDGRTNEDAFTLNEVAAWISDSWSSLLKDPFWHAGWIMDVQRKWLRAFSIITERLPDLRVKGVV